jgi:hypothetical protein
VEKFPRPTVGFLLTRLLAIIESAVRVNTQSLSKCFISFYCFLVRTLFDALNPIEFMTTLHGTFGESDRYQLRILYLRLITALIPEFSNEEYFEFVWPTILDFLSEKVSLVQVKVLEYLIALMAHFPCREYRKAMEHICGEYATATDPQVVSLLREVKAQTGRMAEAIEPDARSGLASAKSLGQLNPLRATLGRKDARMPSAKQMSPPRLASPVIARLRTPGGTRQGLAKSTSIGTLPRPRPR